MRSSWSQASVRDCLAAEFTGEWGANPGTLAANARVLRSTNLDDDGHIDLAGGALRVIPKGKLTSKRLLDGDILLEASGGGPGKPVGRIALFRADGDGPYLCSNFFRTLRAGPSCDPGFLAWALLHLHRQPVIRTFQQQTTGIINLKHRHYLRHKLHVPPLHEQRRIAEILDTIDEAIQETEQIIAKLQQMKRGLLHDLLTRGIDENGELRDPERHPEQFKDSPLGRLPKRWEVRQVEQLLAAVDPAMRSGPFGSALLKHELIAAGVPLLGIDNVHAERFVAEFSRFVSPQKAAELSRYRVRPRDVMITIMGTVGRCAVVPDGIGAALSSKHVWTLTFDQALYSPYLVCLQFNHAPWVRRHFDRDEQGGIMSAIRSETLRTALLPVPPREEQNLIETALKDLERRIGEEHSTAPKLRALKQGLMEDLLTGRVRVAVAKDAA